MLSTGEQFQVQFVWRLPNDDYVRAVFRARIKAIQHHEERYLVELEAFVGGMQEAADGSVRPTDEMDKARWARVVALGGRTVQVAYEAAKQPLYMKLETLDAPHTFFTRYQTEVSE